MDAYIMVLFMILLIFLMIIGLPLAINFLVVGFLGILLVLGFDPSINLLGSTLYFAINTPTFAALPLFILMGAFAARAGFAKKAYKALHMLTLKLPGSLAIATSFACAVFGAICGSALATTAIFGKIALPEMDHYKYDKRLSLGTIASSGTFASMIPPSTGLIVYAMFTNQSIGKLFLAGIIPGIFTAVVYSASIAIRVHMKPELAPRITDLKYSFKEKAVAVKDTWSIGLLILIVLGGIYSGFFTPTEAAAVGTIATLIMGMFEKKLNNFSTISAAIKESAQTSAMIFLIIAGALFFSRFVAIGQIADKLIFQVQSLQINRYLVLTGILIVWFLLGMVMIPDGIKALTLPIVFPLIVSLGFNPIWFGIITQKLSEIACVTPPVGLNVFTMKAVAGENTSLQDVYAGIWPFVLCDIVVLVLLIFFPIIVLYLPNMY